MYKKIIKFLTVGVVVVLVIFVASVAWGRSFETSINPELCSELKSYCKRNGLSTGYCIIVDFSIHSGKERLFVVDLTNNRIDISGFCAHGVGKNFDCITKPKFSNEVGSNLSSLGHYRLGKCRKTSKYNLSAIELHGLDKSNSNAYSRGILIHTGLPDNTIPGLPCLPLSQGCFTIPTGTFKSILDVKGDMEKPLLLYATDKNIFK